MVINMHIGVVGSRAYVAKGKMFEILEEEIAQDDIIVSGGARGVDTWAEEFACMMGNDTLVIRPKWDVECVHGSRCRRRGRYGIYYACRGFERNGEIVQKSERLIAFWDEESRGTMDTVRKAKEKGIEVKVFGRFGQEVKM